jgi:hypothetical protein
MLLKPAASRRASTRFANDLIGEFCKWGKSSERTGRTSSSFIACSLADAAEPFCARAALPF